MKRERITQLAHLLVPDQAPSIDGIPFDLHIEARAEMDPAFGWSLIKSSLDSGKPLPPEVTEAVLLRPYCYVR
jgi:hypothetical protein